MDEMNLQTLNDCGEMIVSYIWCEQPCTSLEGCAIWCLPVHVFFLRFPVKIINPFLLQLLQNV